MPVIDLIGNPDGISPPKTVVDDVRSAVTAPIRTAPGGHDGNMINMGYEIEGRVGIGVEIICVGNETHILIVEFFEKNRDR